jgi:hypothetical protein
MNYRPKSMWQAVQQMELDAYAAGRAEAERELEALRKLEQAARGLQLLADELAEVEKARGGVSCG